MPYYEKFIGRYPELGDLAKASEEEVLKLWQGLGYYSRARNLLHAARQVYFERDGKFPENYSALLTLKGIGTYTAAAVASICYNEPVPVIDGNVERVISRLFKLNIPFQSGPGKKVFGACAVQLMDPLQAGKHNQAMMELGSLICKPANPDCGMCPVRAYCAAAGDRTTGNYPVKKTPKTISRRYFLFVVPVYAHHNTLLSKWDGKDIWKGLFTFPFVELTQAPAATKVQELIATLLQGSSFTRESLQVIHHRLTHQAIEAGFIKISTDNRSDWDKLKDRLSGMRPEKMETTPVNNIQQKFATPEKSNIFEVDLKDFYRTYPMPRLITRYLERTDWDLPATGHVS